MKRTIFTLFLSFAVLSMYSMPFNIPEYKYEGASYVVTDTSVYFFQKIRKGFADRLIAKNEGAKVYFDLENVKEFKIDGKVYEKKYFVCQGSNEVKEVFMQKICTCAGYTLYKRLKCVDEDLCLSDFFVYQGESQMHQLNNENYKVILSFFFAKFNEMFA